LGRIPDEIIRDLRDRADIVGLIGRYVELKKAGRSFKGLCPFHDEKTPSFNVTPDRQIFHCFGCDAGGDAIAFLMQHEGLSFPEAARTLAADCGIEIPDTEGGERGVAEGIFAANQIAHELYCELLAAPDGQPARDYLRERGVDQETVERYGIGFAPNRWDAVRSRLQQKGVGAEVGERAGLLAPRQGGGGHYDRLRGRLIFPIFDVRSRVVGFGGRALFQDQDAKYMNTPESPVFRKREALYGFPFALEPLRRRERAVLCEGYFDCIALHRAGLGEALATCGTALTAEHAQQLRRRTGQIVLLFDGDTAGHKAVERALTLLLPEGLRVRAAALPAGEDPDSYLAANGVDALAELVEQAPEALELVIGRAVAAGRGTPTEKADAVRRVAPFVALVSDPVERSEYTRRLSVAAQAEPHAVELVVRAAARGSEHSVDVELDRGFTPRRDGGETRHLQLLALLLFRYGGELASAGRRDDVASLLPEDPWKTVALQLIDAALEGCLGEDGAVDYFALADRLDQAALSRLRQISVGEELVDNDTPALKMFDDVMRWFGERGLDARERDLQRRMQEPGADQLALLRERQRLLEERRAARGYRSGVAPG